MWSHWTCRLEPNTIWPLIVAAYRLEMWVIRTGYSDLLQRSEMWIYSIKHFEIVSVDKWSLTLNRHTHKPEQKQGEDRQNPEEWNKEENLRDQLRVIWNRIVKEKRDG